MKAGYEVTLIAQYEKNDSIDGVRLIALPKAKNRFYRMFGITTRAFWLALKQRSDVYHFHDPELVPVGLLLKLLTRKKVVYDVHEDVPKEIMQKHYLPKIMKNFMPVLCRYVQNWSSRFFDGIIAAGEDIAESFTNSHVRNKVITLRNMPPVEFVEACNGSNGKLGNHIIYVGGLSTERGIRELVEALNYVKSDVRLFLIGTFEDNKFESEIRKIANEKVQIVGRISYQEVPNFIKAAKIGVICFYPEPNYLDCLAGRNNKLYEYMAGGLAIIGSHFPRWKEVIEGGSFGITVDPKNPKSIASAIDYLLDNPGTVKQMAQNGVKAVREEYNWDAEKEKLLQVYKKLLGD